MYFYSYVIHGMTSSYPNHHDVDIIVAGLCNELIMSIIHCGCGSLSKIRGQNGMRRGQRTRMLFHQILE
jgi:hypothetical protein